MLELEQSIKQFDKLVKASRVGFHKGWKKFQEAGKTYEHSAKLREEILQRILKDKGLAICSGTHSVKEIEHPTQEQLGVFPRERMRLHFYKSPEHRGEGEDAGEAYEKYYRAIAVSLFCPKHYPQTSDSITGAKSDPEIQSEILIKNGKFILAVNQADISKLINSRKRDIEPDGEPYPNEAIYRYFGIPDLPEKPNLDTLR